MTPLVFSLLVFALSVGAGLVGSLLGLGGGFIVIPCLTLLFGVDIRFAIGASIVSVIATSSGAAAAYVREHMTNLRVAMFLELGTTTGALTGAMLGGILSTRWLFGIFGVVLGYSALRMLSSGHASAAIPVPPSRLADRLHLHSSYFDHAEGRQVEYRVARPKLGLFLMYIAGIVSGLLGIGSGALKVPAMDLGMRLPIKVSAATSNLMIGVTAAASAAVYFSRGVINPFIAGPVALGVLVGATFGSRMLGRVKGVALRRVFVVVLLLTASQMLWKGIHGH